ncbi:MAG: RNA 2',3'-cyclic phosphodiesterase [Alkalispirochaeta sp.]
MASDHGLSAQRLFVGMRLPTAPRSQLAERARELAAQNPRALRLIPPENYHITLYFIGDPRPVPAHLIQEALAEKIPTVVARTLPLTTTIDRWGAFPSWKRPRVVWAGVQDTGGIAEIAAEVTRALTALGLEPPRRRFTPHITVGYIRREYLAAGRRGTIADTAFGAPVAVGLRSVSLINSTPGPDGSTYEDVKIWGA